MNFQYVIGCICLISSFVVAADPVLKKMDVNELSENKVQIRFNLSEESAQPLSFTTEHPARIIVDFPGVVNKVGNNNSTRLINLSAVKKVAIVEAQGRTRLIVDLTHSVPYVLKCYKNNIYLTIHNHIPHNHTPHNHDSPHHAVHHNESVKPVQIIPFAGVSMKTNAIKMIDFRRGDKGEGRVIVDLVGTKMPIDVKEEKNGVVLRFVNTHLPKNLQRLLDVNDFATPIKKINTVMSGKDVIISIKTDSQTDTRVYQADNRFTLEVRKKEIKNKASNTASNKTDRLSTAHYTGERLSLNFQDIEVRAVLQLIGDFTSINIVCSDSVVGNVTLRLRNVPWDQALAIILKSKGLDKRQEGNVLWVGPSQEIAAREKLDLENSQQVEKLSPLRSEYIQVNYAKAIDMASLLKVDKNSLLSERGSVSVDDRTNMLLVQDTALKLREIKALVRKLDIPIKQVMIEARIVFASDKFEDALGVTFGGAAQAGKSPCIAIAGNSVSSSKIAQGLAPGATATTDRLGVSLPSLIKTAAALTTTNAIPGVLAGQFGLTLAKLPGGTMLDLELMALEKEGLGRIVASPRLVTSNQHMAYIESGEDIPYNEATSSGAASIAFKKAVLRLEVTPQITPDNHIILNLKVNQDSRGEVVGIGSVPAINKKELQTQVLVANGETIVLGGIYQQDKTKTLTKVPFLGRLPLIGWLFSSEYNIEERKEVIIFVTPKILTQGLPCQ